MEEGSAHVSFLDVEIIERFSNEVAHIGWIPDIRLEDCQIYSLDVINEKGNLSHRASDCWFADDRNDLLCGKIVEYV